MPIQASLNRLRATIGPYYGRARHSGFGMTTQARTESVLRPDRRLTLVYGNCQAEPIRQILKKTTFDHASIPMPLAHEFTASGLRRVQRVLGRASILITQPVQDGYHGLDIGSGQLAARLAPGAQVVTIPSIYFRGFQPYLVNVRSGGLHSHQAPLTGYHDLRNIAVAARLDGRDPSSEAIDNAVRRFADSFKPSADYVEQTWDSSLAELRRREESLDCAASAAILAAEQPMFTVNHPPNSVLAEVVSQLVKTLGGGSAVPDLAGQREFLESVRAPEDHDPRRGAQPAPFGPERHWLIGGAKVPELHISVAHVAYYLANPSVLDSAVSQHVELLNSAGLLA